MHQLSMRWLPVLLLLVCSACRATPDAAQRSALDRLEGRWVLSQLDGEAPEVADGERGPTLIVSGRGELSGFAGVNRLNGKLDREILETGGFVVGPIITTRMAGSPAAMLLEQRYLRALEGADGYELDGERLGLTRQGEVLARFERAP